MSFRPHGRASLSVPPRSAWAVCDRCGALYDHYKLSWQYQWQGPQLQNIRVLVCQGCYDKPQEQLRMMIIPPDPIPVQNARPENYVANNNPLSAIGANARQEFWRYSTRIGNLTGGGGVDAAFNANANKPAWMCANNSISNSSYNNYVGINWAGDVSGITTPSSLMARVIKHVVGSFSATAPNDRSFLGNTATPYVVQGAPVPTGWGAWTTISSGTTTGVSGETISGTCTGGAYQFHRIAFLGDQTNFVAVANVEFNVTERGSFTS